jgi:hypothetical protein
MLFAVILPVLVVLFLLAMERFEAWVVGPPDHDAGVPQVSANPDRTGAASGGVASGGAAPGGGAGLASDECRQFRMRGRDLRPLRSDVTALHPTACSGTPSDAQVHCAQHRGNEADIHRQDSHRLIEGHGTWTYR